MWTGCGTDRISCVWELLLTNSTCCPTEMISSVGLTPASPIVMVGVATAGEGFAGDVGQGPLSQAVVTEMATDAARQ